MRNGILLITTVTAIALAYNFGNRLTNQTTAMVAGAVCGITASIPVSLALFIAASRNWGRVEASREQPTPRAPHTLALRQRRRERAAQPPPVAVTPPQISPTTWQFQPNPIYSQPYTFALGAPREFKIVGDD